ncbi:AfsR/SARP family transcriptional regulator [Saccharothrix variisporea]|uniref:AfsR/SARP family transcriptional regulator n=1 Tax=Saccharothrix variisporea TaxID=543527 RepID=UPI001FE918C0|nr:AfsR/SARP family transcriptional regulator [Saccharothrix variisporea]
MSRGCAPVVARFGVLGPVGAEGPAGPAALTGARQRAVLGVLALHAGQVLPFTRLVDVLWGEDPPRTAVKTLHSHVARIRQALAASGLPDVLRTREPGYLLDAAVEVDAHRFEALLAAGRREGSAEKLREALALWRGDAFADVPLTGWGEREVERLHDLRQSAVEELWEHAIRDGEHEAAVAELPRLLARNPLNERLTRLHMLALYRCGRHTDALDSFQRLRELLADEFGVDPGPEVLELHTAILRRDASLDPPRPTAAPAQLPATVGHFTGRADVLAELDRADVPVVVVSGPAGMGKTSLAVEWAHRVAHRFPGGRLFLDLRGHDPDRALTGAQALAHVLRALDVPEDRIPADEEERAALYRTLLHDRRCLVVLDNAGRADDVLPLVPGGSSLLVVTSRRSLAALATRHAIHAVVLDALSPTDSEALLRKVLGPRADTEATAELARLCGGMPLALRIAAAKLLGAPARPVAALVAELRAARLDNLAVDGDSRTVETVLASAYRPLDATSARLFRRSGIAPGPTFSTALAAALSDVDNPNLDPLTTAHLLTETAPDRFRFHDLVGEYARKRLADDDEPEVAARLLDWYLFVAHEANELVNPDRDLVKPTLRFPPPKAPFAPDRHEALAFLEAERDNLLPVVRFARDRDPTAAWQLTYLLTSFAEATGHWHDRVELCRVAVEAAAGDPRAEAEMLRALGVAYFMTRQLEAAVDANHRALTAVRAAGDLAGEGHVHNNLANAYAELRRFDDAVTAHLEAVDCCTRAGSRLGTALSQRNLGHTYIRMGRPEASLAPLRAALTAFRDLGNVRLEAGTLDTLGEAHLGLGDTAQALDDLAHALRLSRDIGDRWLEWEVLVDIGRAHLDGDHHGVPFFAQALEISREVDDRHGVATVLDLLGRAHLRAGDLAAAEDALALATAERSRVPDPFEEANLERDLGDLADRRDRPADARDHWDRAIRLFQRVGATAEAAEVRTRA